ncbi:thioredoxin family protein [Chryseobacterium phosphatilyticum]|uniref:thioredoxin family protein n=1 Tax=Chryseobacterium phosphatilyticum TaxID=475075 RepID=UPI001E50E5D7|nr:thioredoxin family protein [Chryseobacterium phosphatilyticum]
MKYGIRSVPTFVVLKNNEEVWRSSGVLSESALEQKLIGLRSRKDKKNEHVN